MGVDSAGRPRSFAYIAVVYAVGVITTGNSSASLLGGETLGSSTLVQALRKAAADESVAGISLASPSP